MPNAAARSLVHHIAGHDVPCLTAEWQEAVATPLCTCQVHHSYSLHVPGISNSAHNLLHHVPAV
jgi:hypothetical protein